MNPEDDYENQSEDATPATSSGEEGVLQQSLLQLQKQLRKTDVRCSRLEKICEFQQVLGLGPFELTFLCQLLILLG